MQVFGLILAGGSGTRLWPLSRKSRPKQCLNLGDKNLSLIQQTYLRLQSRIPLQNIWTITNKIQYLTIQKQISELSDTVAYNNVLLEPLAKNTAPAILWSALVFNEIEKDSVMVILPSDHLISKIEEFDSILSEAIEIAKSGKLITFGIQPNKPETGYGYIEMGSKFNESAFTVKKFVEKPDQKTAQEYLASGNFLWNSGMFVFHVGALLNAFKELAPEILQPFYDHEDTKNWLDHDLIETAYAKSKSISIDYAILEKAPDILVIPCDPGWSDLGSWLSVYVENDKDENLNVIRGRSLSLDTKNSVIFGNGKRLISTIGVENLIIVDTKDALLICSKDKSQDVKKIVSALEKQGDIDLI